MSRSRVFFDIAIDDKPQGQLIFELFDDVVPKTVENFKTLCDPNPIKTGSSRSGKVVPLSYKNSIFHRIIPNFMIQGGDFTEFDGTGGVSIFGEKFEDENFQLKHDKPFLLSMANAGSNTNGSQFFITTTPTPHLNGKHVVFGKLLSNKGLVRKIENYPTGENDRPVKEIKIINCGEFDKDKKIPKSFDQFGDAYEEYLNDNEPEVLDINDSKAVIKAAQSIKSIATELFSKKDFTNSLSKYEKVVNYLNQFQGELNEEELTLVENLKISSNLNIALVGLKIGENKLAIKAATEVINSKKATNTQLVKAYYRKGIAYGNIKNLEEGLDNLKQAKKLNPNDPAILKGINDLQKKQKTIKANQKKAMSKFFAT